MSHWKNAPSWADNLGQSHEGLLVWYSNEKYAYCRTPHVSYVWGVTGHLLRENVKLIQSRDDAEQDMTVGQKLDSGKPKFRLIPQHALLEVAKVMTFGAKKYAPDNWRKVPNARDRYMDAALRHINAVLRGEIIDPESGLDHRAHAICSLMMAMESEQDFVSEEK